MSLKALVDLISGKPLLTRKELAQRYSRSLWTIDRWHREGILPKARYLRGCDFPFWTPAEIEQAEKIKPVLKRSVKKS